MFAGKVGKQDWLRLFSVTSSSLALVALGRVATLSDGGHKAFTWIAWSAVTVALAILALILWRAAGRTKQRRGVEEPLVDQSVGGAQASGDHSTAMQIRDSQITVNPPSSAGTGESDREVVSFDRALANALTELDALRRRLERAEESGHLAPLPAHHHQPLADLLTDKGLHSSRDLLDAAYNACDQLRHRLKEPARRWDGGAIPELKTPQVEEADDLPGVVAAVEAAALELRGLQDRGASPIPGEDADLKFGSVEVAEPRHLDEPNAFQESWQGCPVTFNLINPQGGTRARAVRPTVTVTDPDGKVLAGPANARWANSQPPNTAEVERDIPANGAPVAIDTVIQPVGGDKFWLVTDEGLRKGLKGGTAAIDAVDLRVTVSVIGENVPKTAETVRVRLGFPKPALGDEEPSDTLLPSFEEDKQATEAQEQQDEDDSPEPQEETEAAEQQQEPHDSEKQQDEPQRKPVSRSRPTPSRRAHGRLDQLYVEGSRMLKAADPITSIPAASSMARRPAKPRSIAGRPRCARPSRSPTGAAFALPRSRLRRPGRSYSRSCRSRTRRRIVYASPWPN